MLLYSVSGIGCPSAAIETSMPRHSLHICQHVNICLSLAKITVCIQTWRHLALHSLLKPGSAHPQACTPADGDSTPACAADAVGARPPVVPAGALQMHTYMWMSSWGGAGQSGQQRGDQPRRRHLKNQSPGKPQVRCGALGVPVARRCGECTSPTAELELPVS